MLPVRYKTELADLMLRATATRSQRQAAKDANVSPATIGNMVLGRVPSAEICERVAIALSVPVPDMLIAAGYESHTDPIEAIDMCLRGVEGIPEEGKDQIKAFVMEVKEKYAKEGGKAE